MSLSHFDATRLTERETTHLPTRRCDVRYVPQR
jgi:hypothetical protein